MKERPIIFSGEMVRAILSGQKTQTRRIVRSKAQNMQKRGHQVITCNNDPDYPWSMRDKDGVWQDYTSDKFMKQCPYGETGESENPCCLMETNTNTGLTT